jgi:hypothetical protein
MKYGTRWAVLMGSKLEMFIELIIMSRNSAAINKEHHDKHYFGKKAKLHEWGIQRAAQIPALDRPGD